MSNNLNFNSFLKFIGRNKLYTAINVFGLSVSLLFVILIAVYVEHELNIDRQHEHYDRIVMLANEEMIGTAVPVPYWLQERFPEIEKVCPVLPGLGKKLSVSYGGQRFTADVLFADSTFFDFFSFRLLDGDRRYVLAGLYDAVVSESFANKYFPGQSPIGQSLLLSDSTSIVIQGVMENIERSVLPAADVVCRIERAEEINPLLSKTNPGNAGACIGFLLVKPGADLKARTADICDFFKERFWLYNYGFVTQVNLLSFDEAYFGGLESEGLNAGDRRLVFILLSVGILILLFAIINYINLTVAQSGQRAKEMAMRRLLGSLRGALFFSLVAEATLMVAMSFAIGLLLAHLALPYACNLLQVHFTLRMLASPLWLSAVLLLVLLVGCLSGLLPALLISSSKPIDVVRGTFRRRTKMVFSKIFITFQDVITIGLVSASFIMVMQINHIIHAPLGYNTHNIIDVENNFESFNDMRQAEDLLRQLPCVTRVGYSDGSPATGTNNLSGKMEGKSLSFQQMQVDSAAFGILGLRVKSDNRLANPANGWYLNELAFRQLELPETAASFRYGDDEYPVPVAGVLYDFQLGDATRENSPLMLSIVDPHAEWWPWDYIIEVQGDPAEAFNAVRSVFEQVSDAPFNGTYMEQEIRRHFEAQIRLAKIVGIFTCIAILISLLGLVAMSTYFIRQRVQEMALRKLFGSSNIGVLKRLVGTFLGYVGIAFVVAVPFTWLIMEHWLAGYSYRIALNPFIFVAVGLAYFAVSFVAVFFQSWRAANVNPAEHIKAE